MTIQRSKYTSRLSAEDVAAIRAEPLPTRHADLAKRYGVSSVTIARIRRGLTWPEDRPEPVRVPVPANALAGLEAAARRAGVTPAELLARSAVELGSAPPGSEEERRTPTTHGGRRGTT